MTPFEITKAMESMTVLVDTREQPTPKFKRRVASLGYAWRREKLEAGDYGAEYTDENGEIVRLDSLFAIERKMDIDELALCFGSERARFMREFERAAERGTRIHLLVENGSIDDIKAGKYRSKMKPQSMWASLLTLEARYNVHTHFAESKNAGWLIGAILHYELREYLERTANND